MTQALEANMVVPTGYAQTIFQYIGEKRAADYVLVTPEQAGQIAPPSEAVLAAYVKAHVERYSTPD
jgi:hypothetical protein